MDVLKVRSKGCYLGINFINSAAKVFVDDLTCQYELCVPQTVAARWLERKAPSLHRSSHPTTLLAPHVCGTSRWAFILLRLLHSILFVPTTALQQTHGNRHLNNQQRPANCQNTCFYRGAHSAWCSITRVLTLLIGVYLFFYALLHFGLIIV